MNDTLYLRELILGFATLTPLGCQTPPAPPGPAEGVEVAVARDAPDAGSPPRQIAGRCITLDEVYAVQVNLYAQEHARWERTKDQEGVPADMTFSGPMEEPARPAPPTACPKELTTHVSYTRCAVWRRSLPLDESKAPEGDATCCYSSPPPGYQRPCGRLFYVEDHATRAQTRRDRAWMGEEVGAPADAAVEVRARAARAWLEDALEEHASIAAFSRATLELMALGAPSELLAEYQRASLDEIEHARACFALVSALTGEEVSAGTIEVEGPREDLDAIVADVFWGGCVGESVAALCAQRALRGCEWEAAREALTQISEDEARHAALAWSTLSFLGEVMPERVRRLLESVSRPVRQVEVGGQVDEAWVALGRLTAAQEARAEADAWDHLITPMLDALLGHHLTSSTT